jgi:hypothetical protein
MVVPCTANSSFWRHAYRPLPAQTGANKDHGRQRKKDIRSKGEADARQEVGTDGHPGTQDWDANGDRDPLTGGHKASGKPFMSIRDLRGGGDGRGYNGGDMAEEAAEQRRDQQPQPDRLSAEQDHWRSEAAPY